MGYKRVKYLKTSPVALGALLVMLMFQSPVAPGQDAERRISLSEAIDMALRQNRDLQLAQLGVAESRAKKAEARSSYFPRIRNESGVAHITELAGVQIPAGAFGHSASTGLIPAETLFIGQGGSTSYTSGTGLTQPLTQMFKIKNANRAADADLRTSQIELGEAENGIALKVRQLYFSTLIAREQRDAAQFEIDATLTKGKETTEDIAQGRALEVASLESHAALLNAKQSLLTTQIKLRNLSLALNDLLGLPLETHLLLEDSPTEYRVLLPLREDAIRRLLTDSPRVKAAEQTLAKAKAGNAVAKDSYIPDVTGLARYSYQSGVPFLVHNFGTIGFALTYDLFDGGKKKADLDASKARLHQAEVNLEKVKEETTVEIETAYNKVEELKSLVSVAQEALQTRQELARITLEQFNRDATLASSRDNAVAKVHQAQASFLEAMLGQSLAEADILRILGESPR